MQIIKLQLTPDNSNLQGKLKVRVQVRVRVIGCQLYRALNTDKSNFVIFHP